MLVGIRFKPEQVVKLKNGLLVLRQAPQFGSLWVCSVKGVSEEDWDSEENPALRGGYLEVGERGGLRIAPSS